MRHGTTIEDVARAARVSPSTVSRALTNQNYRIGQKTRERITQLAGEMGYLPNPVGSLLKMPQRPTALFVCSDFMALAVVRFIKEMGLRIGR